MSAWPPPGLAAFGQALPFEHLLRGRSAAEAMARWTSEGAAQALAVDPCRVALLVDLDDGDLSLLSTTLASWALQTWPRTGWIGVGAADIDPDDLRRAGLPLPLTHVAAVDAGLLGRLGVDWVVPACAGDVLHPSLAGVVAGAAGDGADIVGWDWLEGTIERGGRIRPRTRHRAPLRDGVAETRTDQRGRAFAIAARHWRDDRPCAPARSRLSVPRAAPEHLHSEPLGLYPAPTAERTVELAAVEAYWARSFEPCEAGIARPRTPAASVSVIVMYRDRAELTCRAIRSVAMQRLPGSLELVLVDNGSGPAARRAVEDCLAGLDASIGIQRIDHPAAFNHSRQVTLAAAHARGEVLVLLNNDAELLDDDALDRLSRWALLPGVATAGGHVVDEGGRCVGGGFHARAQPGAAFNSPVEEARGAPGSRETLGNSFACAAIAADRLARLGGLDAVRFPAGYNDVDFCLRASAAGWTHVNLAGVRVRHAVGASRAKQDEAPQKLLLRQRHPWVAMHALRQAEAVPVELPSLAPFAREPATAGSIEAPA